MTALILFYSFCFFFSVFFRSLVDLFLSSRLVITTNLFPCTGRRKGKEDKERNEKTEKASKISDITPYKFQHFKEDISSINIEVPVMAVL